MIIWFTGLSGSGKSTLAAELKKLAPINKKVELLDGDIIRKNLSKDLGFSKEDRNSNIQRIGFIAQLLEKHDVTVIVSAISPYKNIREEIKAGSINFVEIYCDCPLEELKKRDPKGLYKKVENGEIENFTGISDPYEIPERPDIHLKTNELSINECLVIIIDELNKREK